MTSSPAVVDGKLYIGSLDFEMYCLDISTGEALWRYKTEGSVYSSPAVVDGKVYFGSLDNYLYALDAEDGSFLWKYKTEDTIVYAPGVVDGAVYVGSDDFYAFGKEETPLFLSYELYAGVITVAIGIACAAAYYYWHKLSIYRFN